MRVTCWLAPHLSRYWLSLCGQYFNHAVIGHMRALALLGGNRNIVLGTAIPPNRSCDNGQPTKVTQRLVRTDLFMNGAAEINRL